GQRGITELGFETVLDDDRPRLDSGVVGLSQVLAYLAERLLLAGLFRPHHPHYDARAAFELAYRLGGQQHALADPHGVGPEDGVATGVLESADHELVAALDGPHYLAARPFVVTLEGVGAGHDPVGVPCAPQAVGRDEQVLAACVWDHEAVPARGDLQPAQQEVHLLGQTVGPAARADEATGLHQLVERVAQGSAVVYLQSSLYVLHVPRLLGLVVEELEYGVGVGFWHLERV